VTEQDPTEFPDPESHSRKAGADVRIEVLDALADARGVLASIQSKHTSPAGGLVLRCISEALASPSVFLPSLPEAAIQATQVVDSPRCDVLDLADTLNADPDIASRVVQIANLSFFAGSEPVHTARDAIVRMGIRETRNVVMGLVVRRLICDAPGYAEERNRTWQHSLATAACAQGVLCELAVADCLGFLAGLAHDLGRSAIYTWLGERGHTDISATVLDPIADALHAPLAAACLVHWRLRFELIEAVRWHHESATQARHRPIAAALEAADRLAHSLDGDLSHAHPAPELLLLLEDLGISANRLSRLQHENQARLEELRKIL